MAALAVVVPGTEIKLSCRMEGPEFMSEEQSAQNQPGEAQAARIDPMRLQMFMQEIRDNQNLSMAMLGGAVAAVVGASIWAAISAATNYQIGFMAVGVGFLVGLAVRKMGRGIDVSFGVTGAVLSLLGCALGNYLTVCIAIAREYQVDFFSVLAGSDFEQVVMLMKASFSPMDILFYALAVYYGYRYSIHRVSAEELGRLG